MPLSSDVCITPPSGLFPGISANAQKAAESNTAMARRVHGMIGNLFPDGFCVISDYSKIEQNTWTSFVNKDHYKPHHGALNETEDSL